MLRIMVLAKNVFPTFLKMLHIAAVYPGAIIAQLKQPAGKAVIVKLKDDVLALRDDGMKILVPQFADVSIDGRQGSVVAIGTDVLDLGFAGNQLVCLAEVEAVLRAEELAVCLIDTPV